MLTAPGAAQKETPQKVLKRLGSLQSQSDKQSLSQASEAGQGDLSRRLLRQISTSAPADSATPGRKAAMRAALVSKPRRRWGSSNISNVPDPVDDESEGDDMDMDDSLLIEQDQTHSDIDHDFMPNDLDDNLDLLADEQQSSNDSFNGPPPVQIQAEFSTEFLSAANVLARDASVDDAPPTSPSVSFAGEPRPWETSPAVSLISDANSNSNLASEMFDEPSILIKPKKRHSMRGSMTPAFRQTLESIPGSSPSLDSESNAPHLSFGSLDSGSLSMRDSPSVRRSMALGNVVEKKCVTTSQRDVAHDCEKSVTTSQRDVAHVREKSVTTSQRDVAHVPEKSVTTSQRDVAPDSSIRSQCEDTSKSQDLARSANSVGEGSIQEEGLDEENPFAVDSNTTNLLLINSRQASGKATIDGVEESALLENSIEESAVMEDSVVDDSLVMNQDDEAMLMESLDLGMSIRSGVNVTTTASEMPSIDNQGFVSAAASPIPAKDSMPVSLAAEIEQLGMLEGETSSKDSVRFSSPENIVAKSADSNSGDSKFPERGSPVDSVDSSDDDAFDQGVVQVGYSLATREPFASPCPSKATARRPTALTRTSMASPDDTSYLSGSAGIIPPMTPNEVPNPGADESLLPDLSLAGPDEPSLPDQRRTETLANERHNVPGPADASVLIHADEALDIAQMLDGASFLFEEACVPDGTILDGYDGDDDIVPTTPLVRKGRRKSDVGVVQAVSSVRTHRALIHKMLNGGKQGKTGRLLQLELEQLEDTDAMLPDVEESVARLSRLVGDLKQAELPQKGLKKKVAGGFTGGLSLGFVTFLSVLGVMLLGAIVLLTVGYHHSVLHQRYYMAGIVLPPPTSGGVLDWLDGLVGPGIYFNSWFEYVEYISRELLERFSGRGQVFVNPM
ncbi:MAG: hypothetical protein SGCHY_003234 [Lobulomycetales sp.]